MKCIAFDKLCDLDLFTRVPVPEPRNNRAGLRLFVEVAKRVDLGLPFSVHLLRYTAILDILDSNLAFRRLTLLFRKLCNHGIQSSLPRIWRSVFRIA